MAQGSQTADDHAKLLAELQHRVRNTLASMRALVRRSAETSENLEDYAMHLDGRLDAMARVQAAFVRNPFGGIDLGLLIADELATAHAREGPRLTIEGPDLWLHPRAAEPLGLALHELATNAIKFGALSQPSGRIAVTWAVTDGADEPRLVLDWVESGLALVNGAPPRRGFGRTVLEDMLPHDLRARTTLDFHPEGIRCRIDLPATDRVLRDRTRSEG